MEEVLKKAEAEAEHLEEKAVQIGEEAAKNKMSIVGVIASGLFICMYVSYIPQILGNPWKSVRSSGRLDSAVRRIHQLHDVGRLWIFQRASRLAACNRQFSGHHLWSDGCDYRPSINAYNPRSAACHDEIMTRCLFAASMSSAQVACGRPNLLSKYDSTDGST